MIKFASICPHPPIIIPGIGNKKDLKSVKNTILAYQKLEEIFESEDIETLIMISPHGLVFPDKFNIAKYKNFYGDFAQFNAKNINFNYQSNLSLVDDIYNIAQKNNIPTVAFNNGQETGILDHGTLVPLYYLSKNIGSKLEIIPIYYSFLTSFMHYNFGQILSDLIKSDKYKHKNIGIVASGDLSHRLFEPDKIGKKFDKQIINDIKNKNIKNILNYDLEYLEEAGECGYRSILILLGVLDKINYKPQILSYEGPFGVGYLVANFKLNFIEHTI